MRKVIAVGPVHSRPQRSLRGGSQPEVQHLLRVGHELHLRHILLMQRKLHPTGSVQDSRASLASDSAAYSQRSLTPFRFPLPTPPCGPVDTGRRRSARKKFVTRSLSDHLHSKPNHQHANPLSRQLLPTHHYHKRVLTTLEAVLRSRVEI